MSKITVLSFLYHRVARLSLMVSLGIGALFAHTIWTMRQEQWDYHLHTNANISSTVAKGLEWSLDAIDITLQKSAITLRDTHLLDIEQDFSAQQNSAQEAVWRNMHSSEVLVLDRNGALRNPQLHARIIDQQLTDRDFFQAFASQGQTGVFIGKPTKTLLMGELVLPVARPVHSRDGALIGVVVGVLRMREINAWLGSMDFGAYSGMNVIREDGLILTRFPYVETAVLQSIAGSSNLARFVERPQGSFVGVAVIDGVERLYTHNRVGHYPLIVNVAQSTKAILGPWQRSAGQLAVFAGLLMLACMGLAVMFVRQLAHRERTESALFEEKERMRLTLRSISDAVLCVDAQGRITYLNQVAQQITGKQLQDVMHMPVETLHVLMAPSINAHNQSLLRNSLQQGAAEQRIRISVQHATTGAMIELEESVSLLKAVDGRVVGAVAVLRDVTAAAAQEARMENMAFHDALTGLPNRRLLHDRAKQAMAQAKRTGEKVAVVYLDMDGLKQINDRLGHQAGDAAIVHAANSLKTCVRESDTVCRLGGDEFVLLLPTLSGTVQLQALANKLQQVSAQPFVWEGQSFVQHFSVGIAVYPDHALEWEDLLHGADCAMYAAKQAGRNQIHLYQGAQVTTPLVVDQTLAAVD